MNEKDLQARRNRVKRNLYPLIARTNSYPYDLGPSIYHDLPVWLLGYMHRKLGRHVVVNQKSSVKTKKGGYRKPDVTVLDLPCVYEVPHSESEASLTEKEKDYPDYVEDLILPFTQITPEEVVALFREHFPEDFKLIQKLFK